MLCARVWVASAFVFCSFPLEIQIQSASAQSASVGETQEERPLVVPVPVPAVRNKVAVVPPLPPPAPVDPIENLAGKWSGEGTLVPTRGRNEQFRCIITYQVQDEASRVRQHLRCQSESTRFDAVTRMDIDEEKVTGVWADNVYSLNGTLKGTVTDKGFSIRLYSTFFQARMTVVASGCEQSVKVVPETGTSMKELAATLKKC
jgi:hypothetical protein